jgi:virulence-associated protein VagC
MPPDQIGFLERIDSHHALRIPSEFEASSNESVILYEDDRLIIEHTRKPSPLAYEELQ